MAPTNMLSSDSHIVEPPDLWSSRLERQYREWLPVVEIDGVRAFAYYVQPDAFRRKLAAQSRSSADGS